MSLTRQVAVPNREAVLRALGVDPAELDAFLALRGAGSSFLAPTRTVLLDDAVRDFLALFQADRYTPEGDDQPSRATHYTYSGVLHGFQKFLHTRWDGLPQESRTVQRITGGDVEEFVRRPARNGRPRSIFTMNRDTSIISAMMKWLQKRGMLGTNPTGTVHRPTEPKLLPVALSNTEQERLLDVSRSTASGLRNHTIIHLVINTGLRVQEVSNLRWSSLDLEGGWVRVHGKGNKDRSVPLRPIVVQSLQYYLAACRSTQITAPGCHDALFLNERGPRVGYPMTVNGLEEMIRPLLRKVGKSKGSMHVLRHTFAINCLRRGLHIAIISHLLGHDRFETTRKYLRLGDPEVARELADYFPEGVLVPSTMQNITDDELQEAIKRVYDC